jgi:hypothetical protein
MERDMDKWKVLKVTLEQRLEDVKKQTSGFTHDWDAGYTLGVETTLDAVLETIALLEFEHGEKRDAGKV